MKRIAFILLALTTSLHSTAQTIDDGLWMSQRYTNGTARFVSMGGAFGALGSDFSSIDVNPAGLGVYRTSEFTLSPSFSNIKARTGYLGTNSTEVERGFALDNMGFVFAMNPSGNTDHGLCQLNLSFGYNRHNNFKSNTLVKGYSPNSSIIDVFTAKANFINPEPDDLQFGFDNTGYMTYDPTVQTNVPWDAIMAWNTYLLDDDGTQYLAALNENFGAVTQTQRTLSEGNMGEFNMSAALSFAHKLYLGLSVGISSYRSEQSIKHHEDADTSNLPSYNGLLFGDMNFYQQLSTEGSGFNVKLGAIYTPIPMLRLGFSVHTPTFYKVKHRYSYNMTSTVQVVDSIGYEEWQLDDDIRSRFAGSYSYRFDSPFRLSGSAAVVLGGMALVSVDAELVNYASMRFHHGVDGDDLSDLNELAQASYRNVVNIKTGGEVLLGPVTLRAGYALYPSPYRSNDQHHSSIAHLVSGGVGYSLNSGFFIDAAYQQHLSYNSYRLYKWDNEYSAPVQTRYSTGKFLLTLGFRF